MERPFADKRPLGPVFSSSNIEHFDREVAPLVVIRRFHEDINAGKSSGTYVAKWGTLRYDTGHFGNLDLEFTFHENAVDGTFEFKPMDAPTGGRTPQGSKVEDLGGHPGEFARLFKRIYKGKPMFEFAKLDAASLGHEYFTDYEFKYEINAFKSDFTGIDIDSRVREVL